MNKFLHRRSQIVIKPQKVRITDPKGVFRWFVEKEGQALHPIQKIVWQEMGVDDSGTNCYGKTLDRTFRIRGSEDAVFEGHVDQHQKPHGFCRVINANGDVEFFGCFLHGRLIGNCWKSLLGGSFMVSDQCDFSGNNTVYFYPDCRTALVGTFGVNGQLKTGHVTEIVGVDRDAAHNPEPVFLAPDTDEKAFERDISTNQCICQQPMLADPYEDLFVYVDESLIPDAGQGLFAKVDIEADTVIAFYNGTRFTKNDALINEDSPYKIYLDDKFDLDIPDDMMSTSQYKATLGHKVCHSFRPNCELDNFDHPRFGPIKCIVTLRPIAKDDELTAHYEYILAVAPSWYKKLWARHQKNLKGCPNWKLALALKDSRLPKRLLDRSISTSSAGSVSECRSPEVILEESEEEVLLDHS